MVEVRTKQPNCIAVQVAGPIDFLIAMVHEVSSLAPIAARHSDLGEVRCLIASAEVSRRVGEGLDHHHRMAPAGLKVRREPLQCRAENLASEVRAPVFIKDAESLVVGNVAQPAVALFIAPGKEILARPYVQSSRAETQECTPPPVLHRNVAHDFADQPSAKPVRSLKGRVEALPLADGDWPDHERMQPCGTGRLDIHPKLISQQGRSAPVLLHQGRSGSDLRTLPGPCPKARPAASNRSRRNAMRPRPLAAGRNFGSAPNKTSTAGATMCACAQALRAASITGVVARVVEMDRGRVAVPIRRRIDVAIRRRFRHVGSDSVKQVEEFAIEAATHTAPVRLVAGIFAVRSNHPVDFARVQKPALLFHDESGLRLDPGKGDHKAIERFPAEAGPTSAFGGTNAS